MSDGAIGELGIGEGSPENPDITLTGIASSEAFGTLTVDDGVPDIYPPSIETSVALGALTITYTISLTGVASSEAIGTQLVYEPVYYESLSRAS